MLRHALVVKGDLRNQPNGSIWPQAAPQEQEVVGTIQKRQLFADNASWGIRCFVFIFAEHPSLGTPTVTMELQQKSSRRRLHAAIAGDLLSGQHLVELRTTTAIVLLQNIIQVRCDDEIRKHRRQESHCSVERGRVIDSEFMFDALVQQIRICRGGNKVGGFLEGGANKQLFERRRVDRSKRSNCSKQVRPRGQSAWHGHTRTDQGNHLSPRHSVAKIGIALRVCMQREDLVTPVSLFWNPCLV